MRPDEKDPSWWDQAGVSCRTGAGDLGAGKRPALVKLEPNDFLRLYQTAHSAPAVDKGNCAFGPVAAGKVKANRRAGSKCTRYPHCNKDRHADGGEG